MKANFTTLVCTRSKSNNAVIEYCVVKVSINDFGAFEIKRTFIDEEDFSKAAFWAGIPVLKNRKISWLYKSLNFAQELMSSSDTVIIGHHKRDLIGLMGVIRTFITHDSDLYKRCRNHNWKIKEIDELVSSNEKTIRGKVEANKINFSLVKDIACAICDYDSWNLLTDSTIKCAAYICIYMQQLGYDLEEFYQAVEEIVEAENDGESILVPLLPIAERGLRSYV